MPTACWNYTSMSIKIDKFGSVLVSVFYKEWRCRHCRSRRCRNCSNIFGFHLVLFASESNRSFKGKKSEQKETLQIIGFTQCFTKCTDSELSREQKKNTATISANIDGFKEQIKKLGSYEFKLKYGRAPNEVETEIKERLPPVYIKVDGQVLSDVRQSKIRRFARLHKIKTIKK